MNKLQPLDLWVNRKYKEQLKSYFHEWYSKQVVDQLNDREAETGKTVGQIVSRHLEIIS